LFKFRHIFEVSTHRSFCFVAACKKFFGNFLRGKMLANILTLVARKRPTHVEIGLATTRFILLKFNPLS